MKKLFARIKKDQLVGKIKSQGSTLAKQFDTKHTVKHALITMGLTAVGGPWGLAMGMTYCLGDTVDKSKQFTNKDFKHLKKELIDALKEK